MPPRSCPLLTNICERTSDTWSRMTNFRNKTIFGVARKWMCTWMPFRSPVRWDSAHLGERTDAVLVARFGLTRTSVINACSSSEKAFAWASCAFFSLAISSASSLSIAIRSGTQRVKTGPPSLRKADWPHRLHTSARACPHLRDHSRRNRRARRSRAQCNGQRCKTQTCVADAPCGAIAAHLASRLFAERAAQLPECCPAICMHGPQLSSEWVKPRARPPLRHTSMRVGSLVCARAHVRTDTSAERTARRALSVVRWRAQEGAPSRASANEGAPDLLGCALAVQNKHRGACARESTMRGSARGRGTPCRGGGARLRW